MSARQFEEIFSKIDNARMADDLWTLVNIPSPTGDERCAALAFAEMLKKLGI